ncbi:response regulator [Desulfobacterales bacterium HSG16]|nr:response regulator [Desulfobacterales bacterium HSG16]
MTTESKGIVLLVDDEPNNLAVLNDYLYHTGYEILVAENGEAALRRVQYILPDIILMDVMMPGIDGFETCRRLKADIATRDIPILFMTVVADTARKVKGFEAGAVDFITKPFQPEEVLARVETHLALRRMHKELEEYSERLEAMVDERTLELERVHEKLLIKERLAVLGHFAGSISHEIRNPLAVIDSSVYFLKMKLGNTDKKIDRHLEFISNNVSKSTAIIESLLNLTRMEKPKTEKTDLIPLLTNTLSSSKIPDTVEVALDFSDNHVFVDIDAEQIRMALKNIFKNAAQAMNGSGILTIVIQTSETGTVDITVADTGPGIALEYIEKIFDPLFTTKVQGIGFGLSITKMIIENHGGKVRAVSTPGRGATFIFTLPISEKKRIHE